MFFIAKDQPRMEARPGERLGRKRNMYWSFVSIKSAS